MDHLNWTLFFLINASSHANSLTVGIAGFFAIYAIWLAPLALIAGWLRGDSELRHLLVEAALSTMVALLAAQIIGVAWPQPRPFMMGMGTNLMSHSPDSSFPSDHLTCLWGVAFSLLLHGRTRLLGLALALLGIPMAWARIYLGVHFPLDIVGAGLVSALSAMAVAKVGRRPVAFLVIVASLVHRQVFKPLIRRGWVVP
ncbi:phosphoesterase [Burkholderia sp. Leaf177]|uniref:undecaprenyl-diphosphatase n=1 Tax=Burkholderia sp. Leaf177 TaxID=1736287 RepID=UPI0006FD5D6D|nr:undecaprenyl-diphosphatase [Burkholderia sp. Leaf177]KQR78609.1 phosphoesterase [Burkholderia sp. Leaf177]